MGTQYIRVTVTEEGSTLKVAWENESFECTLIGNVCEGSVTENSNAKAWKVKIIVSDVEIKGEGSTSKARSRSPERVRPRRRPAVHAR